MNTNPFPDRSPCFTSHDLPCIPSPNTWRALSSLLCCPPSVTGFPISTYRLSGLDFTLNPQARRYARPNRVPHRTDCMFASGCSPPHLAVTQLPSATGSGHLPGGDLHPSDRACSQAHGFTGRHPQIAPVTATAPTFSSAARLLRRFFYHWPWSWLFVYSSHWSLAPLTTDPQISSLFPEPGISSVMAASVLVPVPFLSPSR